MFWADRLVDKVIATGGYKPYWVDDIKTPSGRIHVEAPAGRVVYEIKKIH